MRDRVDIDGQGIAHLRRDETWSAEVDREILSGLVSVLRRTSLTNAFLWVFILFASLNLPNREDYFVPIVLRLATILLVQVAFERLSSQVGRRFDSSRQVAMLVPTLLVSGISWALILLPVVITPFLNAGRGLVGAAVLVGMSISVTLLLPVPRLAMAFCAGFVLTIAVGLAWAPPLFAIKVGIGLLALLAIFVTAGLATLPRYREAAEAVIDNRRLTEHLSSSLADAEFLAYRDPLTGLLNRRAFFQRADFPADQTVRHVLLVDLDHFKAINDRFGHDTGDQVLIGVADAIRLVLHELDNDANYAVRMGGEEFALVAEIADGDLALTVGEMTRHAVALVPSNIGRPGVPISASIGIADWHPGAPIDQVLQRADRAMYQAKQQGRNRTVARAVNL